MRLYNRYKVHENQASAEWKLPRRVYKFKRPKWLKIKKKLRTRRFNWVNNRKIWIVPTYVNHIKISIRRKYFAKKFFKVKQQSKKYLASLFENSIKNKSFKKFKKRKSLISSYIIKSLFRVDILLWYLHFFHSSNEARSFINGKNVYVNNKAIKPNYELKKGDLISFNLSIESVEKNGYKILVKKYKKSRHFFPFIEYDYYTNNILVLKDWNQLSQSELALVVKNSKKFKYIFDTK